MQCVRLWQRPWCGPTCRDGAAGGGADGVKKAILILALVLLGVAVLALAGYYRLHLIRLVMRTNLPGWLKMFLYGWY